MKPVKLFYSYSHKDEALRDELDAHLKILQRQKVIAPWKDRDIEAGAEWNEEIKRELDEAQIILLLISKDFIASDFCWDKEMERAMQRHDAGEAAVIPIILRSCDWKGAPFGKLQGLPKDMKPVNDWADRDQAFTNVAQGIRKVAERLAANPR
jgi:TIR domain